LKITPAKVVIAADNQSKAYGSSDPTFTSTTSGLLGEDTLTKPASCAVTGAHSAAGSYPIVCSGADAGSNYTVSYQDGSLTVGEAPVVVTADNQTKIYGSPDPTFTSTTTGLLGEDTLTTPASCSVSGAHTHVGTYPIVCSGADAGGNYTISYQAGTLTITQAPVVVTADNQTKVYGSSDPTFTSTTTGLLGQDTLSTPASCSVSGAHTDVGTYPIVCSGADAGGNYSISYQAGTLSVTAKPITVTADSFSIIYGQDAPTFTSTTTGLEPGESLITPATCGVVGAHTRSGSYPITCSGADAGGNYTISYQSGTYTVASKPGVVTADPQSVVYGSPDPTFTYTVSGLQPGDTLKAPATCSVTGAHTNVGSYPITCSGGDGDGNYTLSYVAGTLKVTKAPVVITADNQTKVYGSSDPTLTSTTTGLLGEDTLTTPATCTVTGAHSAAGSYPIVCSGANAGGNYTISYQAGTLSVTKAVLTVHAVSYTRHFGVTNPKLAATISGYRNGDNASVVSGTPALSTIANKATHPGSYPITATQGSLSAANYSFAFVPGTLRINKAPVEVTTRSTTTVHRHAEDPFTYTFTTKVTNATTGAPVPGSVVTIKTGPTTVCKATTNRRGIATCTNSKQINIYWVLNYTANSSSTIDYTSGHANALIYAYCTHQTHGTPQQHTDLREDCLDGGDA
jgi:hypothetical protein